VIFRVERVDGRTRVTTDEERVNCEEVGEISSHGDRHAD